MYHDWESQESCAQGPSVEQEKNKWLSRKNYRTNFWLGAIDDLKKALSEHILNAEREEYLDGVWIVT